MGKKRFIDPKKSVHFQVVHRSHHDPAAQQADASPYLLKPVAPSYNLLKNGKYAGDLDNVGIAGFEDHVARPRDVQRSSRPPYGDFSDDDDELADEFDEKLTLSQLQPADKAKEDPSLYGIFFKDQDRYDYLKHLKTIGEDPSGVFMEVKQPKKEKPAGITFVEDEKEEEAADPYKEAIQAAVEDGLELDPSDPSIREIMEALEDEAYIDENAEEDFFAALHDEVPVSSQKKAQAGFGDDEEGADEAEAEWIQQFQAFKKQSRTAGSDDEDDEFESDDDFDDDEEVPRVMSRKLPRGARTVDTSMTAMTAATMFRNDKLTQLDDQFEKMLGEYSDDEIGELDAEDDKVRGIVSVTGSRLDRLLDDFLDATDVIGARKQTVVPRIDQIAVLDGVRNDLKEIARDAIEKYHAGEEDDTVQDDTDFVVPEEPHREQWDVESVLSTYSNIYNRPKMIDQNLNRLRQKAAKSQLAEMRDEQENADSHSSDDEAEDADQRVNKGVARPKKETKEEKKRRKQEIKQENQVRQC
ncbi:hypothetical protein BC832DRAFT_544158 [Gaertneriomyces semiglobifer]|nr:hypothetical protein BC832DRAFT_544158 [Gaertneriomyces semiglobifer]